MKIEAGELDHRYTMMIYLIRDERPKYWSFHCPRCGKKLVELDGNVAYMVDISPSDALRTVARVRCNSITCGGRIWFEFCLK